MRHIFNVTLFSIVLLGMTISTGHSIAEHWPW